MMHKILLNQAHWRLKITPRSPLLIKSGIFSPNPALPDMQFIRTTTQKGETVFIPGTSLKGVFRSFGEKILRTMGVFACNPVDKNVHPPFCGEKFKNNNTTPSYEIYRNSCPICKIFGHTALKGRLSIQDSFPEQGVKTEVRQGIAISRLTNAAVKGALFDMEVVVQGEFYTEIFLENFEIWHLGIISLVLEGLNTGLLRIGFGKNRGLGQIEVSVEQFEIQLAQKSSLPDTEIWGIGTFLPKATREQYGFMAQDKIENLPQGTPFFLPPWIRRSYSPTQWKKIQQQAIQTISKLTEN